LTYHTHGVIDGDEAMVGIQAENFAREHPIYFYGKDYMGSLEAYLMALLFLIGGLTGWMMPGERILLSLLVVWLTWTLAGALAEAAGVSRLARQLFQTIAALLAAIPPLYDTVVELRSLGGYIETLSFVGLAAGFGQQGAGRQARQIRKSPGGGLVLALSLASVFG
jgi:hypothetical protein